MRAWSSLRVLGQDGEKVIHLELKTRLRASVLLHEPPRASDAATETIHVAEYMHRLRDDGIPIGVHTREILRRRLAVKPARILNLDAITELVKPRRRGGLVVAVKPAFIRNSRTASGG